MKRREGELKGLQMMVALVGDGSGKNDVNYVMK